MKCIAIASFVSLTLLAAGPVSADHIGIYSDVNGTYCHLVIQPAQPVSVYVVHIYTLGAKGSRFKVVDMTGMLQLGWVVLGGGINLGNPYQGIEIGYGDCAYGHATPLRLDYFTMPFPTEPCATLRVDPYPGDASPMALNCAEEFKPASAGLFAFGESYCSGCSANPTSETTWGRVKALYR
jgi:hypothetical protein